MSRTPSAADAAISRIMVTSHPLRIHDGKGMNRPQGLLQRYAAYRSFCRCFAREAGGRLWVALALLLVIGLLEGGSLLALVPLLSSLGLGDMGNLQGAGLSPAAYLQAGSHRDNLGIILAIFAGLKIAQAGVKAYSSTLNFQMETRFVGFLRERFYRSMLQANWLFLSRQRSSELSHAILTELPQASGVASLSLNLLTMVIIGLVQIGIAISLSPSMTLVALGAGAVIGLGAHGLRRRARALSEKGYGKRAEMADAVSEHLAGMKIAKSHGREPQHFEHFRRVLREIAAHVIRSQRLGAQIGIWMEAGAVVALGLFVYLAVDRVEAPRLLVLVFVFVRLVQQSTALQATLHQINLALPPFTHSERLRERLAAAAESPPASESKPEHLQDSIRLENVSFQYDVTQPTVLKAIDLRIPSRRVVALCGPSGAGKSTIADLLLGLLSPTAGRILVDGNNLAGDRLHDWRRSVGYVPQETFLFHDTIRANLLWAHPGASDADLREALRAAAAEFVDRLPAGIDTVVGDRGVRLSGGERQRIALARALLRRPTLLVLDEATSALDTHNERLVQDAIERLHGEITIVLIAHRLSTVRNADCIVVLEDGAVVETGSWDDLSHREQGAFRRLITADSGSRG
ncbi:MAG TPA: ABC transporter ATP-binding protein [Opitutaceae bacterium]